MQVQQQSELNLGSAKKLEANNATQSKSVDAHESQQGSPFEDQLNKQLDQSKKPVNKENSVKKQDDSGQTAEDISASNEGGEQAEVLTPETTEITGKEGEVSQQIDESKLATDTIMQQMDDVDVASVTIETAIELPETGNALPLSGRVELSTEATDLPEVKSNPQLFVPPSVERAYVQPSAERQVAAAVVVDPILKQTPAQVAESVSVTARPLAVISSEAIPASPVAYKAVSLTDRPNIQGNKQISPINELPAAEVITQTTRLQQVPVATEISSNLSATQNLNMISSAVLSEINTSLNSPGLLNNATGTTLSSTITTALQNPQWSQQMTDQVSFMLKGGFQQAEIKLNPAHLGPMEIKLSIIDDQASVSFVAQHAPVRDALDAAIPRLREMLEQQGLNLADVDVSTQSQQQQAGEGSEKGMNNTASDDEKNTLEGQLDSQAAHLNIEIESGVSIYA